MNEAEPAGKKVYFVSLGCPKNRVDSEIMLGELRGERSTDEHFKSR